MDLECHNQAFPGSHLSIKVAFHLLEEKCYFPFLEFFE